MLNTILRTLKVLRDGEFRKLSEIERKARIEWQALVEIEKLGLIESERMTYYHIFKITEKGLKLLELFNDS
jgi:predicted transcriptional regulator with HTH domain